MDNCPTCKSSIISYQGGAYCIPCETSFNDKGEKLLDDEEDENDLDWQSAWHRMKEKAEQRDTNPRGVIPLPQFFSPPPILHDILQDITII